ncbi:hypothetical protein R50073_24200 [Maricurvus nonylphenolicus]|uniref:hypothetical protein n=1 Tax=Maricurvus nonylphenolicus TaxID=1008307 RepID=UPI0036F1F4B6
MAILGFIVAFIALAFISAIAVINAFFGGPDLGPAPAKEYIWFGPLVCFIGLLWYEVLASAPFTIMMN